MTVLSLSLSLGFNFLLSCPEAISAASNQNRRGTRCVHVLCSSQQPHHSACNGARLPPWLLLQSFHTTSGALGWAPSTSGGLSCCTPHHSSGRTLHALKTGCIRAARRPHHAAHHNSARCKRASVQFVQEEGCLFCVWVRGKCLCFCCKTMMILRANAGQERYKTLQLHL